MRVPSPPRKGETRDLDSGEGVFSITTLCLATHLPMPHGPGSLGVVCKWGWAVLLMLSQEAVGSYDSCHGVYL